MKKILLITALSLSGSFCLATTHEESSFNKKQEERKERIAHQKEKNKIFNALFPNCRKDFKYMKNTDETACKVACEMARLIYLKESSIMEDEVCAESNAVDVFDCFKRLQKHYHNDDKAPKYLKELVPPNHPYELIKEVQRKLENGDVSLEKGSSNLEIVTAMEESACGDSGIRYKNCKTNERCKMIKQIMRSRISNTPYTGKNDRPIPHTLCIDIREMDIIKWLSDEICCKHPDRKKYNKDTTSRFDHCRYADNIEKLSDTELVQRKDDVKEIIHSFNSLRDRDYDKEVLEELEYLSDEAWRDFFNSKDDKKEFFASMHSNNYYKACRDFKDIDSEKEVPESPLGNKMKEIIVDEGLCGTHPSATELLSIAKKAACDDEAGPCDTVTKMVEINNKMKEKNVILFFIK